MDASPDEILIDQLTEEYLSLCRNGNPPPIDEWVANYPSVSTRLREVLATVLMLNPVTEKTSSQARSRYPRIPKYVISRKISAGGMGVVYKAKSLALGRSVALKIVHQSMQGDEVAIRRFEFEASVAAKLEHPNIVPIFDVGRTDDLAYYTMQLIRGSSLDKLVRRIARKKQEHIDSGYRWDSRQLALQDLLPEPSESSLGLFNNNSDSFPSSTLRKASNYHFQVAAIGRDIASALAYSHAHGVLHRDIKPSNLLIDRNGKVWLTDFGLAKTEDSNHTRSGDIVGTLRFMAPERFEGFCDSRSDIYGLGMTLYEVIALCPAFASEGALSVMKQIREGSPTNLRRLDPQVPRDLQTIIQKAIAHDPKARYQTSAQLADDFERFLAGKAILARRITTTETVVRWAKQNLALSCSLIVLMLFLTCGLMGTIYAAIRFRNLAMEQQRLSYLAIESREQAFENAETNRKNLYAAQMLLASSAAETPTGLSRLEELLSPWVDQSDLHGFEWTCLNYLAKPEFVQGAKFSTSDRASSRNTSFSKSLNTLATAIANRVSFAKATNDSPPEIFTLSSHSAIESIAYSGTGDRLAIAQIDGTVTILDEATHEVVASTKLSSAARIGWASEDEELVVLSLNASDDEDVLHILNAHDLNTKQIITRNSIPFLQNTSNTKWQDFLLVHPGGRRLIIPSQLEAWLGFECFEKVRSDAHEDTHQNDEWRWQYRIPNRVHSASTLAWDAHRDEIFLATQDKKLARIDVTSGDIREIWLSDARLTSILNLVNANELVVGDELGGLRWLDKTDFHPIAHRFYHRDPINHISQLDNGHIQSFDAEGNSVRWPTYHRTESISKLNCQSADVRNTRLYWSPDNKHVIASMDPNFQLLDVENGQQIRIEHQGQSFVGEPGGWIDDDLILFFYRDENYLVSASQRKVIETMEDRVRRLGSTDGTSVLPELVLPGSSMDNPLAIAVFNRRFRAFSVHRMNYRSGDSTKIIDWQDQSLRANMDLNSQASLLAIPAFHRLLILDIEKNTTVLDRKLRHQLSAVALSPNGSYCAASDDHGHWTIWDLELLEQTKSLGGHSGAVTSLAWSPDGSRIATGGSDLKLQLWDTSDYRTVFTHNLPATAARIEWSLDGQKIAVLCEDGSLLILDSSRPRKFSN